MSVTPNIVLMGIYWIGGISLLIGLFGNLVWPYHDRPIQLFFVGLVFFFLPILLLYVIGTVSPDQKLSEIVIFSILK